MNQKKQTPKQVKTNKPRKRGRPRKNKAVDPPMIKPINAQELIRRELVVKIPLSSKDIEEKTIQEKDKSGLKSSESSIGITITGNSEDSSEDEYHFLENSDNKSLIVEHLKKKDDIINSLKKDLSKMKSLVLQNIGDIDKVVPLQSHIVHIDGSKSIIEKNCDLVCHHCTYAFDNDPFFIPSKYAKSTKTYHVFGNFCSFNCASKYNIDMKDFQVWERNTLLEKLHRETLRKSKIDFYPLIEAPPRELLIKFGGHMDINKFRQAGNANTKTYKLVFPPIAITPHYVREYYNNSSLIEEMNKLGEKDLMFKRAKPLPDHNNSLMKILKNSN